MTDMGMADMSHMKGMKMSGMSSDQMPGMKDMQMNGMSNNSMPEMKDMEMSGIKDGDMSTMSHTQMGEHTGPLNDQLAGVTPFQQPGPRTTRLKPPSGMISRPRRRSLHRSVVIERSQKRLAVGRRAASAMHQCNPSCILFTNA
jgi:hypothetical protein